MLRYRLVNQRVPSMCLNLAAAKLTAELPSGKAPTTRVLPRMSRMSEQPGPHAGQAALDRGALRDFQLARQGLGLER